MKNPARSRARSIPWRGVSLALLAALLSLGAPGSPASAQEPEAVAGTVVAAGTLRPLAGARVTVSAGGQPAVTDAAGRFRVAVPAGAQATLRVSLLGFQEAIRTVRAGETGVRVALQEMAVALDALVITGTAGGTEKRALGNAVATIDAERVTEVAPIENVHGLLNGRAVGVIVQPTSGAVGTGARIRVRGVGSLSLSSEPLIYVDGVRVNNQSASGPQNQAFGSASISRLNDFNPEDIASIEVIKGPAAATLYGTEASNGVIQIITRRGAAGATRWNLSVRQGLNYLRDPEGRFWTNYQRVDGDVVELDIVERETGLGRRIFRNGRLQEYDLSAGGGTERFRYFAGGGFERNEGAERSNDLSRGNARLNLSLAPSDRLDLDVGMGYVTGTTNLSAEGGFGGRVWSTVLADPRNLTDVRRRGFHSGTPEQYDLLYNFWQDLERVTGSLQLRHRPTDWLAQRLSLGLDRTREGNVVFIPRVDSLTSSVFGTEALGSKEVVNRDIRYGTVDYSATASLNVGSSLRSVTTFGAQYFHAAMDSLYAAGRVFPAPGLSAVEATTQERRNSEDSREDVTVGVFVQQQLGWAERHFLTLGLRADDNSAFGSNFDRVYYPKASASWVVSDEGFFRVPFVSTLQLRAAYGESGNQPQTFAALRTYRPETGPDDVPAVTPQFIGNPDLGPERGREVEVGFDAGLLDERLRVEMTYYRKRTGDAILEREIPPSGGFPGFQFFNAGEVLNSGVEVLARAQPILRETVGWEVQMTLATNHNEVTDLGFEDRDFVSAGTFLQHREGFPVGAFFHRKVLSAELNAAGEAVNVRCDDGVGSSMPCTGADGRFGTADDAPLVYLGRTVPSLEGALSSTLTLGSRLRLYAMVDFKRGHRKVDGNTRVRCTFFGGRCRENFYPLEFDARRIAAIQSNTNLVDFLIDDAAFAKLREVSVSYSVPEAWARRAGATRASITVAGRNLFTWTGYGGLEPEAMFLGGTRGGNHGAFEQTTLPQLTQWVASLSLSF